MASFASKLEIEQIIQTNPWSCRLVHDDGTYDDFTGFLAQWGRPSWFKFGLNESPVGRNRYVVLATTEAPAAQPNERLEAQSGGVTKILQVLQCQVLDYKIEYVCEELT